ncbi:PilT/PilU family type 4a pilus ATPase [bacterium]|nr:PilT/PilU family type 4a pilus ATPase [bacterium]
MPHIDTLFTKMLDNEGSDLHLLEGEVPKIRIHGQLRRLKDHGVLDTGTIDRYLKEICAPQDWQKYLKNGDLDFACQLGDRARFRANYYFQHHGKAAVFRTIPNRILSLEELGLPPVLKKFARQISGLILVTGPTGSGKSTTLAALLNEINTTSSRYVLTIEEPIEFVHENRKSYFCQREVGKDTPSFQSALRSASRQNADVVLVGEMRDYETISLALSAAAMGKLVLGTLHTNSAVKTVDRIIDVFPSDEQWKARNMLADSLYGVCAQILLRRADGKGRVPANEVLVATQGLASSIRDGDTANIRNIIQSGKQLGMHLMDESIRTLLDRGLIDPHEAYMKAHDKERFKLFKNAGGSDTDE